MSKLKILFAAANPLDQDRLELVREHQTIKTKVRAATHPDAIDIQFQGGVRFAELLCALHQDRPHVVHFSGHGRPSDILFLAEDGTARPASQEDLKALFSGAADHVRLVVLNACYSAPQAEAIKDVVGCAIGMSEAIPDAAAIDFAATLYQEIAFGKDIHTAFEAARHAIAFARLPADDIPKLLHRPNVDPAKIVLVDEVDADAVRPRRRPMQHEDFVPRNFTGREHELDELEREVREKLAAGATLGFWGLYGQGGVGKTGLAAKLAQRLAASPELFPGGVLWVDFVKYKEQPHETAARWLRAYELKEPDPSHLAPHECLQHFRELVRQRRPLIVLDNVTAREQVEELLVSAPGVVTLITTRNVAYIPPGAADHRVDALHEDDALDLLMALAGEKVQADQFHGRRICKLCDYFPVFLRAAGADLRSRRFRDAREYADELECRPLDQFGPAARVFDLSWEGLTPQQREAFAIASQYPAADFGVNFFQAWFGVSELEARGIAFALYEYASLLETFERNGHDRFRMHDRVRDYAESMLSKASPTLESSKGDMPGRLMACWFSWDLIAVELVAVGVHELARQYEVLQQRATHDSHVLEQAALVGDALRLSAHALAEDPTQLAGQLLGRLLGFIPDSTLIADLLNKAISYDASPWLWPRTSSLTPPGGPLLRTLVGHSDRVLAVLITPDDQTVITASADKSIRLWDIATGHTTKTLAGHDAEVTALALVPDTTRLIAASADGNIHLWDFGRAERLKTFRAHTKCVNALAITQDGCNILSASDDSTVKLWCLDTGAHVRTFAGHVAPVRGIVLLTSPHFASTSDDTSVRLWNILSGAQLGGLVGHDGPVKPLAHSAEAGRDGAFVLISGSSDGKAKDWDVPLGLVRPWRLLVLSWLRQLAIVARFWPKAATRLVSRLAQWTRRRWASPAQTLSRSRSSVNALALAGDGATLFMAHADGTVSIWDYGAPCRTLLAHGANITALALTSDNSILASASDDCTVRLWEWTRRPLRKHGGHAAAVTSAVLTQDGRFLISGSYDGALKVWDCETHRELRTIDAHDRPIWGLVVTADGSKVISASSDGTVKMWLISTGAFVATLAKARTPVFDIALLPGGQELACALANGTVEICDIDKRHSVRSVLKVSSVVTSLDVGGSGDIVCGCSDGTVYVVCARTGKETALSGHTKAILDVAISRAGQSVVSASLDHTVRVWDLRSKAQTHLFTELEHEVSAVSFLANEREIVTGSGNGALTVRCLDTGEVRSMRTTASPVSVLSVLKGDNTMVEGSSDGTIRLWDTAASRQIFVIHGICWGAVALAISPKGGTAVAAYGNGTVNGWDLSESSASVRIRATTSTGRDEPATRMACYGASAVLVSEAGKVTQWDMDGDRVQTIGKCTQGDVLDVTRDGALVLIVKGSWLHLWNSHTGSLWWEKELTGIIRDAKLSEDRSRIGSLSVEGLVTVHDANDGRIVKRLGGDAGGTCVAISNKDNMVCGRADGRVDVWGLQGYKQRWLLMWTVDRLALCLDQLLGSACIAMLLATCAIAVAGVGCCIGYMRPALEHSFEEGVSAWGRLAIGELAIASWGVLWRVCILTGAAILAYVLAVTVDEVVVQGALRRVWRWTDKVGLGCAKKWGDKPVRQIEAHTSAITCVAISSDGRRLATASTDRKVKVWDLSDTAPERPIAVYTADMPVWECAMSANGEAIIASDGEVHLLRCMEERTGSERMRRRIGT